MFNPFSALSALCLALGASARITNITFPATGTLGGTIQANVSHYAYIQNWDDLGILFGFQNPEYACGTCIGEKATYVNVYNNKSISDQEGRHYLIDVPVPQNLNTSITYLAVAAVPYTVGASGGTRVHFFNSSITLNGTSDTL